MTRMRATTRRTTAALATLAALALSAGPAAAHGIGNRYALSLPQWLFISGGAGVVLVSFAIVSVFAGRETRDSYRSLALSETPLRALTRAGLVRAARVATVALLAVALVAGVVAPPGFQENLLPLVVWVGWWVGFTFAVIFVGNAWPVVNPWKTVYEWVAAGLGRDPSLDREYRLGSIPAAVLFFAFAWVEIVSPFSENARAMVTLVVGYSLVTWGGMLLYGKETWLDRADPFTRLYDYFGRFAPLARVENGGHERSDGGHVSGPGESGDLESGTASGGDGSRSEVRAYGVGLVAWDDSLGRRGALVFLLTILYTVTFDGFVATPEWRSIVRSMPDLPVPYLGTTVLMALGVGLFLVVYLVFADLMGRAAGTQLGPVYLAQRFALSLLPIAIVYQVSHFYTFLLVQGQYLVLALADPFGLGWTLPGLAFEPSTTVPFLSVQFVWLSQVLLILVGHVVAVWVAHRIAMEVFADRRQAVVSQLPMMALMVLYTTLSLWILTRPVVEVAAT